MVTKKNKYQFYEPVFQTTIIYASGKWENIKLKGMIFKKEDSDLNSGAVSLIDREDEDGTKWRDYLIHVEDPHDFYTLMHETFHLARHILVDRGVPFTPENDEVFAYYQTFLFKKLWRHANKK